MQFYKKNLLPLIIVNFSWVLVYNLFFIISGKTENVTIINLIEELFFLRPVPLMNMWYMPMIVGMYIGLPFVAKIVKTFSKKSLFVGAFIVFIISFLIPFANFLIDTRGLGQQYQLIPAINLSFLGGTYGLYILIGFWIRKEQRFRIKASALIIAAVAAFLSTCAWQVFTKCDGSNIKQNIWYSCPFIPICCASLFILINRINVSALGKKFITTMTFLSRMSLGIFFAHIIIQECLAIAICPLEISSLAKMIVLLVCGMGGSIGICWLLSKSRIGSKYLLLIKTRTR